MPDVYEPLRKAKSIQRPTGVGEEKFGPRARWLDELVDLLTQGIITEEPGPVDLILGAAGLYGGYKAYKTGTKALLRQSGPIDAISEDPFALKKGPIGRRQFLHRASGLPRNRAVGFMRGGVDEALKDIPISEYLDVTPGTNAAEDVKKYIDTAKLARNINRRYRFMPQGQFNAGFEPDDISDVGNILSSTIQGPLEEKFNRAMATDAAINRLINTADPEFWGKARTMRGLEELQVESIRRYYEKAQSPLSDRLLRFLGVRK